MKIFNKWFFFIILVMTNCLFANSSNYTRSIESSPYKQGEGICPNDLPKAYNAEARFDTCMDFFVKGSFIYWEILGDQTDIGVVALTVPSNILEDIQMSKKYQMGFKVGLGYNLNHDNWGLFAEYTYLHKKMSSSYNPLNKQGIFYAIWMNFGNGIQLNTITTDIKGSWRVDLDKLDLEVARSYYLGTKLIVKPFMGISLHFLDQEYNFDLTTTGLIKNSTKTDSWALGPRFGFNADWIFCKNFRLFGSTVFDLMFSENKTSASGQELGTIYTLNTVKINNLRDVEELSIGLGWGSYFSCDNYHFDIAASYEVQRYGHTNYMAREAQIISVDGATAIGTNQVKPGDLFLHGLTVAVGFNF